MIKLSIIIVTFNNFSVVKQCIESIFKYNDINEQLEVIVVDNSSQISIIPDIKRVWPMIKCIPNNKNGGFGRGNNIGEKVASGEIIAFINPDTEFIEPIFKDILNQFEEDPNLGLMGCQLINNNKRKVQSFGIMPEDWNWINLFLLTNTVRSKLNILPKYFYIQGADIFMRKKLFNQIGKFDENIFLYGEEIDLVHRIIKENKYKIKYDRSKSIIHKEKVSTSSIKSITRTEHMV